MFIIFILICLTSDKSCAHMSDFTSNELNDEYAVSNEEICSNDFYQLNMSSEICYKLSTKLVKGPYVCSNYKRYIQVTFDSIIEEISSTKFANMDIWIPIYRNTISGYNPLTYYEITANYGKNATIPFYNESTVITDLCVKLKGTTEVLSDCDEKAIGLCAYRKDPIHENYDSLKTVGFQLHFDNQKKVIYLELSPLSIVKTFQGRGINVFCFTDANSNIVERLAEADFTVHCESRDKIIYTIGNISAEPSRYWCEAFNVHFNRNSSKTIIAHSQSYGHEFVVNATVIFDILPTMHTQDWAKNLELHLNITIIRKARLMKIYSTTDNSAEVIFHLTTHFGGIGTIESEYQKIVNRLNYVTNEGKGNNESDISSNIDSILGVLSSEACLPEITVSGQRNLTWPLTPLGETAVSNELCFQQDGNPVTRECKGNFLDGAYWSHVKGLCSDNSSSVSTATDTLFELYHSNASVEIVFQNVTEVVAEVNQQFKPIDVYFVAQICKKVYSNFNENVPVERTMTLINNMMNTDTVTLQLSQKQLNSTDAMLNVIDTALATFNLIEYENGYVHMIQPNLMSLIVNLSISNIRGIALFSQKDDNYNIDFKYIYEDTNIDELLKEDGLDVATYVPEDLINHFKDIANIRLVITVFYSSSLFNEDVTMTRQSTGKIVSVSIMGYPNSLPVPIAILYRPNKRYNNELQCAYWKFGKNDQMESIKGSWELENEATDTENGKRICQFSHLTHFSLLVVGKVQEHTEILNAITGVGSILSILGIVGIFITALVFKSWRNNAGHKILLQFSVTNILKIIFLYLAGMETFQFDIEDNRTRKGCAFLGMMLHYTILAEFFWMLIIAGLQYRRFVLVLCPDIPHLMWKASLLGWGIPLFPVAIVYVSSSDSYISNQHICYPDSWGLYLGLLLPISIIILLNITIFIRIILSVSITKVKSFSNKSNQDHSYAIINLSILLFFLLGVSWIFGFAAALDNGVLGTIFSYLFCFTAPLQGLVSFLYFIVLNDATKKMWYTLMSVPLLKKILKAKLSLRRYRLSKSLSNVTEHSDDTFEGSISREEISSTKYQC